MASDEIPDCAKCRERRRVMLTAMAEVDRVKRCNEQLVATLASFVGGDMAKEIAAAIDERTPTGN
jgi:hypothetical protein